MIRTTAALVLVGLLLAGSAQPHAGTTISGSGTPAVDGVVSSDEWRGAGRFDFPVTVPGEASAPATLRVMDDGRNLYLAVTIGRALANATVSFAFDNDHDGSAEEEGDDHLGLGVGSAGGRFSDGLYTFQPPCSPGSLCGTDDPSSGGTIDGAGKFGPVGAETHFELSHPIDSADDAHDVSLLPGATVGFGLQVSVQAAGTTAFTRPFGRAGGDLRIIGVDPTPPDTVLDAHPPERSASNSATFAFSSEPSATFACKLDTGEYAACSSPRVYTGLGDGTHTFVVRATDAAGNPDPTPVSFTWTVDTQAPETAIDERPPPTTNATSATFSFSSEPGATFTCRLDGGAYGACASPHTYGSLSAGRHSFEVRAADTLGNVDATPAAAAWVVDRVAPIPRLPSAMALDATGPRGTRVSFDARASDDRDPRPEVECEPASRSLFPIGRTVVACRAVDAAGNRSVGTFTVVVRGAVPQLRALVSAAVAARAPTEVVAAARAALAAARRRAAACDALVLFAATVRAHAGRPRPSGIPLERANALRADAGRIRRVLRCA